MKFKEGDVVVAPFKYGEEHQRRKTRPCVIWRITPVGIEVLYVSTKKVAQGQGGLETEVAITADEAAAIGLLASSRIDFSKRDVVQPGDITKVVGSITKLPRYKILQCAAAAKAAGLFT